jgi:uncharacterized NAD(P)/FAD-binding protein YdhS
MEENIVIIGSGFTGSTLALELAQLKKNAKIYLFEKEASFEFRGPAYTYLSESYALNVKAIDMGVDSNEPKEFYTWLNRKFPGKYSEIDFVSRKLYGDYLTEKISPFLNNNIFLVRDEVIDIELSQKIVKAKNQNIKFDKIILAIGGNYLLPQIDSRHFEQKEIRILGTGLSAIDSVNELVSGGYKGKIHLYSRRGLIPLPHDNSQPQTQLNFKKPWKLMQLFKEVVITARGKKENQYIVHEMRPHLTFLWQNFTEKEKRQFAKYIKPFWEVYRHRMSQSLFVMIEKLKMDNKLEIHKLQRDHREMLNNELVINCTGFKKNNDSELINNLINKKILNHDPLGWGINTSLISTKDFFVVGPLQKYEKFEITAVKEIREEVKRLARSL